jgi:putative transposase
VSRAGGHISAADLAKLALPGLPSTKRGINLRAAQDGWAWTQRPGRGGGRLYSIASLPDAARAALEQHQARRVPANLRSVGRPKGSDFFTRHPEVADAVEAIIGERQIADTRILELLAQRFAILPSRRTLARFRARLEEEKRALLASTRDPDAYKSRYKLALGRADGAITHANQRWEIDTTKADVLTKGGRICVLGLIDVYSRRARFLVVPSESAQSVRRLLVTTIRAWGVMPEEVGTDNGSGFVNESLKTALPLLGIRQERALPGAPEKKPFVERLFGTFTRERAQLLDGFAGHNVAQAQALRAKAKKDTGRAVIVPHLTPEELQTIIDAWTDGVYNQREHGTTRAAPLVRFMSSKVPSAAAPSDDQLRIALSKYEGPATVGKRGVQWKRGRYWAEGLAPWIGRQVVLRRDEDDLGSLFVFDEDGRFIDVAVNHERAGLSETAFAAWASSTQASFMNEARAQLRAKQRAFSFEEVRDALLRSDAEKAGKLATLPLPTIDRSTPHLDSFAQAPAPALPTESSLEDAMIRTAPRRRSAEPSLAERIAAADRVIAAAQRGEAVDPDELQRAELFATSSTYRAEKMLTGDFRAPTPRIDHQRRYSA